MRHSTVDAALLTEVLNLLNSVSMGTVFSVKSFNTCFKCSLSAPDTNPRSFCHSFTALSIIRYLKSEQKSAVRVRQVATVTCYGSHAAGSKPNEKLFTVVN